MRTHPIAAFIKRHKLTQAEAAQRLGISQQDISAYCQWKAVPRLKKLRRLALVLGVSPTRFLPDVDVAEDKGAMA